MNGVGVRAPRCLNPILGTGSAVEVRRLFRRTESENRGAAGVGDCHPDKCRIFKPIHPVPEPFAIVAVRHNLGPERLARIGEPADQVRVVNVEVSVLKPGDNTRRNAFLDGCAGPREILGI
ncbi:MAG TPA: hypothetical protein GYA07_13945 [Verrucomicrobia bacterium]|nr:hypothetical protein [Verrucomicrobiota bacterium]